VPRFAKARSTPQAKTWPQRSAAKPMTVGRTSSSIRSARFTSRLPAKRWRWPAADLHLDNRSNLTGPVSVKTHNDHVAYGCRKVTLRGSLQVCYGVNHDRIAHSAMSGLRPIAAELRTSLIVLTGPAEWSDSNVSPAPGGA
jgi:hypothetical protein